MESNLYKYIVYLTYNVNNKKFYVGVHKTLDPLVFDGYLGCGVYIDKPTSYAKGRTPLHAAILQDGVKAFKRITLKVFDTLEDALDLEGWLVTESFIKRTDTYNAVVGGGMPPLLNKEVYQFNINGELIKKWESESAIRKYYECSVSISDIIKSKRSFAGSFWSFNSFINVDEYKTELNHGFISQYNLDGFLLNTFKSTTLAAQKLGLKRDAITQAVFRKKQYSGYYFLKSDVDIAEVISNKYKPKLGKQHIYQYTEDGNFFAEYETITAVTRNISITPRKLKIAIADQVLTNGYYWSYKKCNNYFDIPNPNQKPTVKIAQYDLDDNLIKIWDSPKECKKEYSGALRCCQGYLKSTKGYKFKYIEED